MENITTQHPSLLQESVNGIEAISEFYFDCEDCALDTEEPVSAGPVKKFVKYFENMKEQASPQTFPKMKSKKAAKPFTQNEKEQMDNLADRWTIPRMNQPLAERQPNCLVDPNLETTMFTKPEEASSSSFSSSEDVDSQSLPSVTSENTSNDQCVENENIKQEMKARLLLYKEAKSPPKFTNARPFNLRTQQRGQKKEQEFMEKLFLSFQEEQKLRIPRAQGLPFTTDEPRDPPKPPVKESTKPLNLKLCTDIRAQERAEFDVKMKMKQEYIEEYKLVEERIRKKVEEEEIRKLRKQMVPHAQIMPFFDKPFVPKKSDKPLTVPMEPRLGASKGRCLLKQDSQRSSSTSI